MSNYIKELNEKSFYEWFQNEVVPDEEAIGDIIIHGVKVSHPAFYRYADTSMLYDRYTYDIWRLVNELAQSHYECTTIQMLGQLKEYEDVSDPEDLADCLVCLAATKLAMECLDERMRESESDQDDNKSKEEK